MTVKAKAVNYTAEQVEVLKAEYTGADNKAEVASIAQKLGKQEASVRAKLASLGLYKANKGEKAEAGVTKRALVEKVGAIVGLQDAEMEGLEKATKSAIEKVLAKLVA